jgi:hypothetical protein
VVAEAGDDFAHTSPPASEPTTLPVDESPSIF